MCRRLNFSLLRVVKGFVPMCGVGLAMLATGCSGDDGHVPVYPVKGKVSVKGEVPEGALVVFYPTKAGGETELRPSAKVKPDGSFSLTTYDADDGAPSGDYIATIQWNKIIKKGNDFKAGPDLIPKTYARRESSLWKVKVAEAPNDLEPLTITK
jgi:hypothetical protein